jgi:hypothetical protein
MKKLIIALGAVAVCTPALADYYVVREKSSNTCKVVETKPADTTTYIVVGDKTFKTKQEAEGQVKVICTEKK